MRIGIDLDGVLVNWDVGMLEALARVGCPVQYPVDDPTFPPVWHWPQHYGATEQHVADAWEQIRGHHFFWARLPGLPTAADDLRRLQQYMNDGHEVYFLTTRSGAFVKFQTEAWLASRGILCPTVILADTPRAKGQLAEALGLTAVIDDRPDNLEALPSTVQPFLKRRPFSNLWYDAHPGRVWRVDSVAEMLDVLIRTEQIKAA